MAIQSYGQSVTLSIGSASGLPGGSVSVPINLVSSGGAQTGALQWSFPSSLDIASISVTAGPAAINAQKSLICTATSCLVFGNNSNSIADGVVATATFKLVSLPSLLTIPLLISNVQQVTPPGSATPAIGVAGAIQLPAAIIPTVSALSCGTTSFSATGSTLCTVSLSSAALTGGFAVPLSSSNTNVVIPGSITVGAGQTTASFQAAVAPVTANQPAVVTAGAKSVTFTLTAAPITISISGLTCLNTTFTLAGSSTCTVSLSSAAPSGGFAVALSSNNASVAVPSAVTVLSAQTTVSFAITVASVPSNQTAVITAGGAKSVTLTLTAAPIISISGIACTVTTFSSAGSTTCTVSLSSAASTGGFAVQLSSNNSSVTTPAAITVLATQTAATFQATVAAVNSSQTAQITAGGSNSVTLTLIPAAVISITGLSCNNTSFNGAGSAICTVSLSSSPTSSTVVTLSSSSSSVSIPSSIAVAAGQTKANFTATVAAVTSDKTITITSTLAASSLTVTLTLAGVAPPITLTCKAPSLTSNVATTCTVGLTTPLVTASTAALSSSNGMITVPASVKVAAGVIQVTFTATASSITSNSNVTLTAALNGSSAATTVAVTAPAVQTLSLSCLSTTVIVPGASTCKVILSQPAGSAGAVVTLSSSNSSVIVPPSAVVPAAQLFTTFGLKAAAGATGKTAVIAANLNGNTSLVTLTFVGSFARLAPSRKVMGLSNAAVPNVAQSCSPGSMATLTGSGFLASGSLQATATPWPTELGGLKVKVENTEVPMSAVSDSLIRFQCPSLPDGTSVGLTVEGASGDATEPFVFRMEAATPAVYVLDDGTHGAIVIAKTGELAIPAVDSTPSRPAKKGESLSIYANGLGVLREQLPLGTAAPLDRQIETVYQVRVVVGEVEMATSFAGLAPGQVGVDQVNVVLSPDVPEGDAVPVYLKVILPDGRIAKSNIVSVAIRGTIEP